MRVYGVRCRGNIVPSDAALPTAIPPKLRSHERANTTFLPLKIHLCEHNKFFSSKIWIFDFFVVTLQQKRFRKKNYYANDIRTTGYIHKHFHA